MVALGPTAYPSAVSTVRTERTLRRAQPFRAGAEGAVSTVRTERSSAGRSRSERERREP
jgi:hypothetical protein